MALSSFQAPKKSENPYQSTINIEYLFVFSGCFKVTILLLLTYGRTRLHKGSSQSLVVNPRGHIVVCVWRAIETQVKCCVRQWAFSVHYSVQSYWWGERLGCPQALSPQWKWDLFMN